MCDSSLDVQIRRKQMIQMQTRKWAISFITVMIASFLLSACKNKKESNDAAMAALSQAVTAPAPAGSGTPVTQLVFFPTDNSGAGWGNGNLGGRSGADAKCAGAKPAGLSCPNGNHALLSFSATDQVKDMPANYGFSDTLPVKVWDGTKINATVLSAWSGMLSGGTFGLFSPALSTAFGLGGVPYFATGSDINGNVSANNCSGFTSATGIIDDVDMTNGTFMPEGTGDCATFLSGLGASEFLICVCY